MLNAELQINTVESRIKRGNGRDQILLHNILLSCGICQHVIQISDSRRMVDIKRFEFLSNGIVGESIAKNNRSSYMQLRIIWSIDEFNCRSVHVISRTRNLMNLHWQKKTVDFTKSLFEYGRKTIWICQPKLTSTKSWSVRKSVGSHPNKDSIR